MADDEVGETPEPETVDVEQMRRELAAARQQAAGLRTKVKELEPRAEMARQLEEAGKSEVERLTEQHQSALRDLDVARAEAVRFRIAAQHGIGEDDFGQLGVGDEEQITANAVRIAGRNAELAELQAFKAAAEGRQPAPPGRRPVEDLRPGATPAGVESEDDVIYASIYGPQK